MRRLWLVAVCCFTINAHRLGAQPNPGDPTKPTLVTLKLLNATPKNVFDELAKEAGTEFLPANFWDKNSGQSISIDASGQPFWLAMKDACAKAGVSLKYATDTARPQIILSRDNQDWTNYPAVVSGPFYVSLIGLQRDAVVDMRKPAEVKRTFFAKFTVFCEPRVRLLRGSLNAKVEQASDDKNNSLAPKDAQADPPLNFVTSWVYNLEAKLDYPQEPGTKIGALRCSARFIAQTQSETIEINEPLTSAGASRSVAGRKVILKELRRADDAYQATVTFVREDVPPQEWENAVFPGNALRLVDGADRQIVARGFGLGGKGNESTYVFKFERDPGGAKIGKPIKLVWEIPTQTREVPLTFEFKDLPLP